MMWQKSRQDIHYDGLPHSNKSEDVVREED